MLLPRVTIIGSDTLLGQDLAEVFAEGAPDYEVRMVGSEVEGAILTERGGEPVVLSPLDQAPLESSELVVFNGAEEIGRKALKRIRSAKRSAAVIDLSYALEDEADSVIAAPFADSPRTGIPQAGIYVIAHPAAGIIAEFLRRLHEHLPVRRSVIQIFEPASERGKAGIESLQRQTTQLLSFKPVPKDVFDEQLSFNMLAGYGAEAPVSLQSVEERIERHLASLLGRGESVPMPSIRVVQAPVFHAYCFSMWVEFTKIPKVAALRKALASERIDIRAKNDEPPTNQTVASQSGMTVGRVEADHNDRRAAWFWIVADNHRARTESALCLARLLIGRESKA